MKAPFRDRRATGLLNRVRNDVSHLREDLGSLISHTTRQTLPNGARDLADHAKAGAREVAHYAKDNAMDWADQARSRIAAGGALAVSRLRDLRPHPTRRDAGWVGGALLVGAAAYGIYMLYKSSAHAREEAEREA